MFKIKKKVMAPKLPILYNVIEDYLEFDEPGNVTVCAMTEKEDLAGHAKVLSESYGVPIETMTHLLITGGLYVYPQEGGLVTKGLFACRVDPTGAAPKQTWVLDLLQFAEAEQVARARGCTLEVNGEILACQIVNGQPAVARFNAKNYLKAKELVTTRGLQIMDALSEVACNDPAMMRGLVRKERSAGP
jgi:hypothetical protein